MNANGNADLILFSVPTQLQAEIKPIPNPDLISTLQETSYHGAITDKEGIIKRAISGIFAILAPIVGLGINFGSSLVLHSQISELRQ